MNKKYQRDLLRKAETRFKTIMIGSIARVEEYFGYLWAHGKDNPTEREEQFRVLWDELRNEMLNNGNYNIRKGLDEIYEILDVNETKYEYNFIMKDKRSDQDG